MKMIRSYGLAMVLVCMTLMIASCSNSSTASLTPAPNPALSGAWKEEACTMGFVITNDNRMILYDDITATPKVVTFAGTIVNKPDLTATHGLVIIKIDTAGTAGAPIGSYTVSHWKNYDGISAAKSAGQTYAKDSGWNPVFYATLSEAEQLTETSDELNRFCCDKSFPYATYVVEYIPGTGMNKPAAGKTTFQLVITKKSDGSAAPGLTPALSFLMTMPNGMQHATPIDLVSESGTPGTYDCTVYYHMGGTWDMSVTVDDETTTFNPDVAMYMGTNTPFKAVLTGQNDLISSMSGTSKRSYYLFNDGLTSGMSGTTFHLFIAATESMMNFPALSSAATTTLHDENGAAWAANPILVEGSLDTTSWTSGTNTTGGHWSITFASGIASGATNTIYVRLSVGKDGGTAEQKTTDGNAASGSNGYQTFSAIPGM